MSTPTSADDSTRNVTETVAPGRISKNPKACEECRRRKQKCDGKAPCHLCTKRNSPCSYRSYIRQRGGRSSLAKGSARRAPSLDSVSNGMPQAAALALDTGHQDGPSGLPRSMPPRLAIFNNIRATQDTSRGKTELFYGASSPFSVLQHLDAHLPMQEALAIYPDPAGADIHDGDKSIRSYNYQNIVFDHLPDPIVYANDFESPSYSSAKIALRNFLVTASFRFPFLDFEGLCANFEKLYKTSHGSNLNTADRALVIAALGLGAFPLTSLPYRQLFLTQARAEAANILYDINTKTVQATLVLAQFEFESGSPNICYLHLGGAIRKAFAAGVHRGGTTELEHTMRALYCYEILICFILGKHPSLTEEDVPLPQSQDSSYMAYYVRLCAIVRSAHRLYHLDDTVVADLNAADAVDQELGEYMAALKAGTRIDIGGQVYALSGEELSWHIALSYVFEVTRLLLFRPFLLLCLELKRRGVRDIRSERNGGAEMKVVYTAAARSVHAAQAIIKLCDSLFSLQIGTEGLYSHGFYLESACFVLALAAVHQSAELPQNCFENLQSGLRLLRQLGSHEPVRSTSAAVEQMIERIRVLTGRPLSSTNDPADVEGASFTPGGSSDLPMHLTAPSTTTPALDPFHDTLTPVEWDHDLSLDDLWSMMDWNVGFPSMDFTSTPMPGL